MIECKQESHTPGGARDCYMRRPTVPVESQRMQTKLCMLLMKSTTKFQRMQTKLCMLLMKSMQTKLCTLLMKSEMHASTSGIVEYGTDRGER